VNRRNSGSRFPALCAALGGTLLLLASCKESNTLPIAAAKKTIADSADQVLFGMRTTITDGGLKRAEVLSDTAFFFDENTRLEMRGAPLVRGIFFDAVGAKEAVLTSRTGLYTTRVGVLEARGDVVLTSVDGRRLETPFLRFDQHISQITSDTTFVLTSPDREVRGVGFVTDPDMQNIRVLRLISSKIRGVALPER
jgi:LPS export ABC transporter protein LptC